MSRFPLAFTFRVRHSRTYMADTASLRIIFLTIRGSTSNPRSMNLVTSTHRNGGSVLTDSTSVWFSILTMPLSFLHVPSAR